MKNIQTAELRQLTNRTGDDRNANFQPNGQRIAYLSRSPSGSSWKVRLTDLNGQNDVVLATLGTLSPTDLRWKPAGDSIYFARSESLFVLSTAGGSILYRGSLAPRAPSFDFHRGNGPLLLEQPGEYTYPVLCLGVIPSPCGCESFIDTLSMPWRRVALRNTLTGDTRYHFTFNGAGFYNPRWSYDGTRIAYSSDQNNEGDRDLFVGQVSYNHAPVFSAASYADQSINACVENTRTLSATDPDGETVTYQGALLPTGATFYQGNKVRWTPDASQTGDHYLVIRALDGSGGLDQRVYKWTVLTADTIPAAVTNLSKTGCPVTTVALAWTAPGADANCGTATAYDIRYSTSPIVEANFGSATQVSSPPTPDSAGTLQNKIVTGLSQCTTYYFALKTRDNHNNWSAVSNVISVSTICPNCDCSGHCDESAVRDVMLTPLVLQLGAPQPNPVTKTCEVSYGIPDAFRGTTLEIAVFDVAGRRIRTLVHEAARPGRFTAAWDLLANGGTPVGQGVYRLRLRVGEERLLRTMVVTR